MKQQCGTRTPDMFGKDYRLKENRSEYFTALYDMNLKYKVMPGLVYLYMPMLAERYGWDCEQKLWFAFLNGMTQNPITSLRMFQRLPECPPAGAALSTFDTWFNENWDTLQFDTDRRHQKRDTVKSIKAYAQLVSEHGGFQVQVLTGSFSELWHRVRSSYYSFGRLSSFSYLEYVKIMGFGADCDTMFFDDKSGSKSHRNGMLFLLGKDELVWDKRCDNFGMISHSGDYDNFTGMCSWLERQADDYLACNPEYTRFTLESNLCTFKNHFFGRRAPGSYADMAWERIVWHDERGLSQYTEVFKDIRSQKLPEWLRMECSDDKLSIAHKAVMFSETGYPHRGQFFLPQSIRKVNTKV